MKLFCCHLLTCATICSARRGENTDVNQLFTPAHSTLTADNVQEHNQCFPAVHLVHREEDELNMATQKRIYC